MNIRFTAQFFLLLISEELGSFLWADGEVKLQQIHKTTHRDLQDTSCCLLQSCYSSWANIKLMSRALQSQQPHFCCTKQFQPLTSGIISVPVKTQSMSPKYSFINATVMMFCERLGTRIGRYTACFVSKKDNIHSCVMCRPAAIAGLPKIVKANTNVLGLAKLSQTKNHMHCCCTKQQFQPLTSGNSSQNSVHESRVQFYKYLSTLLWWYIGLVKDWEQG